MRSIFPILANQLITLVLGLVGVTLITKLVPVELYRSYGLFVALTQIGPLVTHSGLINLGTRYWQRESKDAWSYARFLWNASWRELRLLFPILALIAVVQAMRDHSLLWLALLPLLAISNVGLGLFGIGTGVLNAGHQSWRLLLLAVVGNSARVFVPLALAWATVMSLGMLSAGYALHALIIMGALVALFSGAIGVAGPSVEKSEAWLRELKDYGRPFMYLGAGAWLLQYVDRWIVAQFFDLKRAGLFTAALQLGAIIPTLVVGALMQMFFPGIFRKSDLARTRSDWSGLAKQCDGLTLGFALMAGMGLVALHFLAPMTLGWLIDVKYAAALAMLIPAGLVTLAALGNQFYYLLLQGQHNSAAMVKVMLLVAGLKTLASALAAAVSWKVFLVWLCVSPLVCMAVGRTMILRLALAPGTVARSARGKTQD